MTTQQTVVITDDRNRLLRGTETANSLLGLRTSLQEASVSRMRTLFGQVISVWKWIEQKRTQQISARRLKVTETVTLGEKRFVSILQVDGTQFLIGVAAGNVSLLAVLENDKTDDIAVQRWCQSPIRGQSV